MLVLLFLFKSVVPQDYFTSMPNHLPSSFLFKLGHTEYCRKCIHSEHQKSNLFCLQENRALSYLLVPGAPFVLTVSNYSKQAR
jgi:hypothetical protein